MMWHAQELEPKFLFRCPNSIDHRMVGVGIHFLIWQWHRVPKMARWSYFYCFQWCFGWLKNPPPNGRWSRTPVFALADKQTERAVERERETEFDTRWTVFQTQVRLWLVAGLYEQSVSYLCIGDRDYHNPFDDQICGMRFQSQGRVDEMFFHSASLFMIVQRKHGCSLCHLFGDASSHLRNRYGMAFFLNFSSRVDRPQQCEHHIYKTRKLRRISWAAGSPFWRVVDL